MGFHHRRQPFPAPHIHEFDETIAEARARERLGIAECQNALRVLDGAIPCEKFQASVMAARKHLDAYVEAGR